MIRPRSRGVGAESPENAFADVFFREEPPKAMVPGDVREAISMRFEAICIHIEEPCNVQFTQAICIYRSYTHPAVHIVYTNYIIYLKSTHIL